jgi:hypothetical protein
MSSEVSQDEAKAPRPVLSLGVVGAGVNPARFYFNVRIRVLSDFFEEFL